MTIDAFPAKGFSPPLLITPATAGDHPDILALTLPADQRRFIADNAESLAEAGENPDLVPVTLRVAGRCVGFALYTLDPDDNNYWIYRLMIGAEYQGRGYGASALHALVAHISALPACTCIMLGVYPDNERALALYRRYGFRPTGEKFGSEIVLRYAVDAAPTPESGDATVDALYHDGQLAALYDAFQPRAQRRDFDYYLPLIAAHRRVLDIGCGTGTLLQEARGRGHGGRLTGIDPAAPMIALARRDRRIEWICDYLARGRFSASFDLALMTGHAFQALIEDAQIIEHLRAVRSALGPGGLFALETRNPAARVWEDWEDEEPERISIGSGVEISVTTRIDEPFDGRTLAFSEYFESAVPGFPRISRSRLRFVDRPHLLALLGEAGFTVEADYGDFDRTPFTPSSPEILILARARG